MKGFFRRTVTHPALAIGGTLLWGVVELLALQRRGHAPRDLRH